MHGILNVNKPAAKTSRDIVNIIQRIVRPAKTGHAGTLDPLATGVLVCPVGPATKLIEFIQRLPKTYEAVFHLGKSSDTEDIEGEISDLVDSPVPTRPQIEAVLPNFLGTITQIPPAYSALKINGKRAYALARAGEQVELKGRPVKIYDLKILAYDYPSLTMRIDCGSGTYVRSLGRDIARKLGTEAIMAELARTAIGNFTVETALSPDSLTAESIATSLLPTSCAVQSLPKTHIDQDQIVRLSQGKRIHISAPEHAIEVATLDASENLIAIVTPDELGNWKSIKNFANEYVTQ